MHHGRGGWVARGIGSDHDLAVWHPSCDLCAIFAPFTLQQTMYDTTVDEREEAPFCVFATSLSQHTKDGMSF